MSEREQLDEFLKGLRDNGLSIQSGGFEVDALPTGIASFDVSTGIGGLPRGRIVLTKGLAHAGKSLLYLVTIARAQADGGRAAFVDLEHALTPGFAQLLGVKWDDLVVSRPKTLNKAYDVARELASSGFFDIVVFDSACAIATDEELALPAGSSKARAAQARVHSEELRKINSSLHDRTVFAMVNQMRLNPNPPVWAQGPQYYSPGGVALNDHYPSMTIEVKKGEKYKTGDLVIGQEIKTFITKNKVGTPYLRSEFNLMFSSGIDKVQNLVDLAMANEVIRKKSSWFYVNKLDEYGAMIGDELRFAGRAALENALRDDSTLYESVERQVATFQGGHSGEGEEE